ncbi:hypothetical protein U0070_003653 [Myodes glareolus]|uniref:Uncharacterized protein n=1 Tax=Myodes glareolus TaxID=447135 RepID=A0AAW0HJQ1_MYOGA
MFTEDSKGLLPHNM